MRLSPACSFLILLALVTPSAGATEVLVAAPEAPEILARLDLPTGIEALAISPDGSRLAYALPSNGKQGFSDVVWAGSSQTTVTVPGAIRDLLFMADGQTLVGLQFRAGKKTQGDTFLFAWSGEPKIRRIMRVPPSSNDLDRWPGGDAILLACRNEIRTILPPDFRSGPLFSFPGDNFALTSLGNSSYVVVGRSDGLFLLDLSVPSGRESMPILAHLGLPAAVAALADFPGGDELLVRLIDGRLFRATFDPPGFAAAGTADQIAGLSKATSGPTLPFAPVAATIAPEPEPIDEINEKVATEPVRTVATEPAVAPPVPETRPPEPVETAEVVQVDEADDTVSVDQAADEEPPVARVHEAPSHQLQGRVSGRLDLVEAVVLLGPDNILREAARVQPDSAGAWGVDGLAPGRYRIQLDGGGDLVLVAEPRFLMVDIGEAPTRAAEIKAVRSF